MKDNTTQEIRKAIDKINNLARGFTVSQVLFAANEANVFSLLDEKRTAQDVAVAVGWNPRATRMLLDGLVALELVTKSGDSYRNGPAVSACLVPGRPGYQGHIVRHLQHMSIWWARLDESLRSGTAVQTEFSLRDPEQLRAFILGMSDIAKLSAKEILGALDISPYRHMLDLGGGPATYAIALLGAHPALKATVFDRPEVLDIARDEVAHAHLQDRISYIAGDMTEDDFGSGYDLILISNIIHSFGPSMNRDILRKCYNAMTPSGLLIIKDFLVENDRSGPAFGLMFALNMLVGTSEGDTYTFAEVEEWTREAGFSDGRVIDLTPQSRLWLVNRP